MFNPPTEPYTAGSCAQQHQVQLCMKISPKFAPPDAPIFSFAESIWSSIILEVSPQFVYNFETINTTGLSTRLIALLATCLAFLSSMKRFVALILNFHRTKQLMTALLVLTKGASLIQGWLALQQQCPPTTLRGLMSSTSTRTRLVRRKTQATCYRTLSLMILVSFDRE